jgi:hypothetical protein
MSEFERQRRKNYRKNRKRWIFIQSGICISFLFLSLFFFISRIKIADTYEIPYNENGKIDYSVNLLPNDFYAKDEQQAGQAYVASLIDTIPIDFYYFGEAKNHNAEYLYSYSTMAFLEITDNSTGLVVFSNEYPLTEQKSLNLYEGPLVIQEHFDLNYSKYNQIAESFTKTFGLTNVTSRLTVLFNVDIDCSVDDLDCRGSCNYTANLNLPLTKKTVEIHIEKSISDKNSFLVSESADENSRIFGLLTTIFATACIFGSGVLIAFILFTRNHDINYSIKVRRTLNAYRSYIQKINHSFDTEGFRSVYVNSFPELLQIRDATQSPILMYENEDETCATFLIPSSLDIIYLYEIKVENFDEIYGNEDRVQSTPDEDDKSLTSEETGSQIEIEDTESSLIESNQENETVAEIYSQSEDENEAQTQSVAPQPEERIVLTAMPLGPGPSFADILCDTEEENAALYLSPSVANTPSQSETDKCIDILQKEKVEVRYRTSFGSRLIQAPERTKEIYSKIKNYLLSFTNLKSRTSFNFESFKSGRINIAKLDIKGSYVNLYLALNPDSYDKVKYRFQDVSGKTKFTLTPLLIKIKSELTVRLAIDLTNMCMANYGITQGEIPCVDYKPQYESTEELIRRDLIKVLLPRGTQANSIKAERADVGKILKDAKRDTGSKSNSNLSEEPKKEAANDGQYEIKLLEENVNADELTLAIEAPTPNLSEIDYVKTDVREEGGEERGVEVIGVVWPERRKRNHVYNYDPNGEILTEGDVVLVPTHDSARNRDVIRKAAVAHGNHKTNPDKLTHPLKKIIGVVKRKIEAVLSQD